MAFTTALLVSILSLQTSQGNAVDQTDPLHDGLIEWAKLGYLRTGNAALPNISEEMPKGAFDEQVAKFKQLPTGVPVWHQKVVIFTRSDVLATAKDSTVRIRSGYFVPSQIQAIREAITRSDIANTLSGQGQLKVQSDVSVEEDSLRLIVSQGAVDSSRIKSYLMPRFNAGTYEADDKVFRGPYESVVVVTPAAIALTSVPKINGAFVSVLGCPELVDSIGDGKLESQISAGFRAATIHKSASFGIAPGKFAPASLLAQPTAPSLEQWKTLQTEDSGFAMGEGHYGAVGTYRSKNFEGSVVADAEVGQALTVTETGNVHRGGISLPNLVGDTPLTNQKTLSFSIKTSSTEPLSIRLNGANGKVGHVVLGCDLPRNEEETTDNLSTSIPVVSDGSWHTVSVSVDAISTAIGGIKGLAIVSAPNSVGSPILSKGGPKYSFSPFKFTNEVGSTTPLTTKPDLASDNFYEQCMAISAAKPDPSLIAKFKGPNSSVRLNAVLKCVGQKSADFEAAFKDAATYDYNTYVSEAAIKGLSEIGSESAIATLKRLIHIGVTEYSRGAAAIALSKIKGAIQPADLIPLADARSTETRRQGLQALNAFTSPEAAIIRMVFLGQSDPELKIMATEATDPTDEERMRRYVLWSAVNEPSDAVRLASYIKLTESPNDTLKGEGIKGIKDDSIGVRIGLVNYLGEHQNAANRSAILAAIIDRSASVRAAALEALSKGTDPVKKDEIANLLTDEDPLVQMSLIDVYRAGKFRLETETIELLKKSFDSRVRVLADKL